MTLDTKELEQAKHTQTLVVPVAWPWGGERELRVERGRKPYVMGPRNLHPIRSQLPAYLQNIPLFESAKAREHIFRARCRALPNTQHPKTTAAYLGRNMDGSKVTLKAAAAACRSSWTVSCFGPLAVG